VRAETKYTRWPIVIINVTSIFPSEFAENARLPLCPGLADGAPLNCSLGSILTGAGLPRRAQVMERDSTKGSDSDAASANGTAIVPMAHGDLHDLTLPHVLRHLPVGDRRERPLRVLDLGAGTGRMSQLLVEAGYAVEACDLEPSLFQLAGVSCKRADLNERLPYDDAEFDAVACVEVLEHVDGHDRLFREIARILRPGGYLIFTTPNVMSIKSRLSFLWTGFTHSFYPLDISIQTPQEWHISGHGANRYRFMMQLAGLELRKVTYDKLSRSSLAFLWLAPWIMLRSWLQHGRAPGAMLNNSLAALFGRTMIGVGVKSGGDFGLIPASPSPQPEVSKLQSKRPCRPSTSRRALTVIIPCKNEAEHLSSCIASAWRVADEVLVADSGSTDGSLNIAREMGCRVIEREYVTSGDFKNWAIPQATHEWVLVLDADERVTPALAREIERELAAPRHDGYWIYRRNYFLGHPVRFGPWKNDRCLRLFRRDLGRYVGPTDHAEVELSGGTVGFLRERMTHYTCASYDQYLPKLARYADVQARLWNARGRRTRLSHLLLRLPLRFLQGYVWRLGFLDGLVGVQVCALVAYLSWLKHASLWQLQQGRAWRDVEKTEAAGEPSGRSAA
jgi:SAM-dependent methyltransferase